MNPGKMDRRITIQKRAMTRDATGSTVETWTDESRRIFAEKVKYTGSETVISDADRARDFQQWRIRYRDITPTEHRIVYQGKTYDISSVIEEGRRDSLLIDSAATQQIS